MISGLAARDLVVASSAKKEVKFFIRCRDVVRAVKCKLLSLKLQDLFTEQKSNCLMRDVLPVYLTTRYLTSFAMTFADLDNVVVLLAFTRLTDDEFSSC